MKNLPDWFFDKTDWQEKTLGEVAEKIICGGTPDTANRNFYEGNVTWISSSDLKENDVHKISKTRFITEDAIKNSATKKIPPKSILIVTRVGVGKVALSDEILCTSQDFTNLILKENFLPEFFVYQIAIKMKIAAQQTQGTAIKGITTDEVKKIKIKIPSLEEQKKIAEYFTHLDNAINAQDLKLKFWRDAEKALLQKIFSQEFYFTQDNGEKFPAWQEKTLGEVAKFLQGLTYSPKNMSDDGIIVFRSSNIQNDSIDYSDVVKVDIDKKFLPKLQENDILMCVRNGSKNLVGKTALIEKRDLGNTWGAFMMIIRSKEKNNFLYQYFKTNLFSKAIYKDIGTTTVNQITKGMLNNLKIKIPSLEEQKKIAEYFSSLDKIIDAENKMLESLRLMKRGLLQKLFI